MNKKAILTVGLASAGIVGLALIGSGVIEIKKNVIEIKKNVIEIKKKPKKGTEGRCMHGFATINTRAPTLVVAPGKVDVQRGCKLIFQIVPPRKDAGDVTTKHEQFPKGDPGTNPWLTRTNTGQKEMVVIEIPKDATLGEHKYSVSIPGFPKLDPHAKVIP